MKLKDFRDFAYYAMTQRKVPYEDAERVGLASRVVCFGGLTALVATVLINGAVSIGPRETLKSFCDGVGALYQCGGTK